MQNGEKEDDRGFVRRATTKLPRGRGKEEEGSGRGEAEEGESEENDHRRAKKTTIDEQRKRAPVM